MQRTIKDYIFISLKGMAMGAADAVPGVSGGTIAFITGIYEELIATISQVNLSLLSTLKKEGILAAWKQANGNFLLALLLGIAISFVSFMRLAKYLIEFHPILIWSFFFGLVLASIFFVAKQLTKWSLLNISLLIVGAFTAYYITTLPALAGNDNSIYFFFAAAIAICAMILPGISGSFILVLLGAYKGLSDAIHDLNFKKILIFIAGAIVGLLSFSKLLKWLFSNHKNATLAVLTGFIAGSLNKIWPWKITTKVLEKKSGLEMNFSEISDLGTLSVFQKNISDFESYKAITETSVTPLLFNEKNGVDPQITFAIGLMCIGFLSIFILERLGSKK